MLAEEYDKVESLQGLADRMNRTVSSLKTKAFFMGLTRTRRNWYRVWTEEKDSELRKLYPDHTNEEIGRRLGIPKGSVQSRGFELGLRKDKAFLYQCSMKTTFKKGSIPANKGKKWNDFMSKEGQERSRSTCFKKGHVPANKKSVGHKRKSVDGYWEVKIAEPNVFKAIHRILWEQHYGPIPKGMQITFIDGNKDNVVIENLRAETMTEKFNRCCSIHTTLPAELRQLVQLKGVFNRQINKANKNKD